MGLIQLEFDMHLTVADHWMAGGIHFHPNLIALETHALPLIFGIVVIHFLLSEPMCFQQAEGAASHETSIVKEVAPAQGIEFIQFLPPGGDDILNGFHGT